MMLAEVGLGDEGNAYSARATWTTARSPDGQVQVRIPTTVHRMQHVTDLW